MHPTLDDRGSFLNTAGTLQGGIVLVALGLGWFSGTLPLQSMSWDLSAVAVGSLAILPMLGCLTFATKLRRLVRDLLGRPLSLCRWYDLVLLAALAGFGEELLFRGVLQPWLGRIHPWVGIIGANLIFGALHALTPAYAVFATAFGLYLSWLYVGYDEPNLARPIVAHALYDYVAFLIIVREVRREATTTNESDLSASDRSDHPQ
jgi:membrane protease YdiL (CAAX protease family)